MIPRHINSHLYFFYFAISKKSNDEDTTIPKTSETRSCVSFYLKRRRDTIFLICERIFSMVEILHSKNDWIVENIHMW